MANVYDSIPATDDEPKSGNVYDSIPAYDDEAPKAAAARTNSSADFVDSIPQKSSVFNDIANQAHAMGSGLYHQAVGGYKGLAKLATTRDIDAATNAVEDETDKSYRAPDSMVKSVLESKYNPLNFVQEGADYLADKSADAGLSPGLSTAIKSAPTALAAVTGVGALAREGSASSVVARGINQERAALPAAGNGADNTISESRQSMGAAQVNPSPFNLTGQETGRGSPWFPQVKLAKNAGDVPLDEQSTRAGIVREVLNDAGEDAGIRTGVLTGNEQTLRSEYQAAKNPNQTPANALMANQIGAEQRALPKFAQQRVDATGADPTLTNDYQRGETINNAFYGQEGLKAYLNSQKDKIFKAALEKNGNDRIPIDITDSMFQDPQFAAGAKLMKHEGVVSGAQDLLNLAKNVGFKDPVTGVQYEPGSVAAYQAVTKALNKGWTPENSITIGKINDAINQDIAKSGGGDLYRLGNAVHRLDKGLLSDSKGISDVFGEVDPNGVQTKKAFDNIPKVLNDMPLDQWRHIHDTLDTLSRGHLRGAPEGMDPIPQELQQAASRAKAEMHGALAREIYAKGASNDGGWSATKANSALNGRVGQKILDAFPPDEIRKFQTLNAAGHIMPGVHPYEGAGAQTARMEKGPGFVENYAPKAGFMLGAKSTIPAAPFLGEKLGEKVSGWTRAQREAKQAADVSKTLQENRNRASGGAVSRATGGRVGVDELVEKLVRRWRQAKRETDAGTKELLKLPDPIVTKALNIAQERL